VITFWKKAAVVEDKALVPWERMVEEDSGGEVDEMVQRAIDVIKQTGMANTSLFQRRLHIGYPRAARLVDELEENGIIGPAQPGGKERDILIDLDDPGEPEE
jgi:S-DNA-T family DNA segregation ATPase FtsK/SpoIIIE